ncbi:unnamed protein product [Allacma fusca]|uniref:Uncharacterized protein n=1 Tax=Allacma fusca TaxID=39272 RepID=A0A8J2JFP4_9HEXA|nr:unnamed protein product [Allacma fusca]
MKNKPFFVKNVYIKQVVVCFSFEIVNKAEDNYGSHSHTHSLVLFYLHKIFLKVIVSLVCCYTTRLCILILMSVFFR